MQEKARYKKVFRARTHLLVRNLGISIRNTGAGFQGGNEIRLVQYCGLSLQKGRTWLIITMDETKIRSTTSVRCGRVSLVIFLLPNPLPFTSGLSSKIKFNVSTH